MNKEDKEFAANKIAECTKGAIEALLEPLGNKLNAMNISIIEVSLYKIIKFFLGILVEMDSDFLKQKGDEIQGQITLTKTFIEAIESSLKISNENHPSFNKDVFH